MPLFAARPITIDALQFDGTNGSTVLTKFGDALNPANQYTANADGSFDLHTIDGETLKLRTGAWLHKNIEQKLIVTAGAVFYKTYDYVSG